MRVPGAWFGVAVTALVISGIGDELWRVYHPGTYPDQLSLAIPPWVGAMCNGGGFGHCWGRYGEFCVAVGRVTRTARILAYCMLA